jgi:hypothetical protein
LATFAVIKDSRDYQSPVIPVGKKFGGEKNVVSFGVDSL